MAGFLLPTSCFLSPASYPLIPIPCFLFPIFCFLPPASNILFLTSASYFQYSASYLLLPTSCSYLLLPTSCFLTPTSYLLPPENISRLQTHDRDKDRSLVIKKPSPQQVFFYFIFTNLTISTQIVAINAQNRGRVMDFLFGRNEFE